MRTCYSGSSISAAASLLGSVSTNSLLASAATQGQRVKSLEKEDEETDWQCRVDTALQKNDGLVKKLEVFGFEPAHLDIL